MSSAEQNSKVPARYYDASLSSLQGSALSEYEQSTSAMPGAELLRRSLLKRQIGNETTFQEDGNGNGDVTGQYNSFMGWIAQKQAVDAAHASYVSAMTDEPGRQSTLLTGLAANAEKTILGSPMNPNKTPSILGA